jgi:hypothetical protein
MICAVSTVLMITTATVAEESEIASFLLPYCKSAPGQTGNKAVLYGRCMGSVQGTMDTLSLVKAVAGEKLDPSLCVSIPRSATIDQAVNVVVKYGDAHPEQTHVRFTILAVLALTDAWSCKK